MRSQQISRLFVFCVIALVLFQPVSDALASDELIMGVFPRRNAKTTIVSFRPLAQYLSKKMGRKVKVVTAKDFPVFWQNVKAQKYDIVHFNQLHYIESHEKFGYQVILSNEEFGLDVIRGAIVVRKDSGINSLADLKGRKIVFGGGKKAMIAYVVNTHTLQQAGLNEQDYQWSFARTPPNATISVYRKQADAAGIGDVGLKIPALKSMGIDVSALKLIGVSKPLPHLPWAVKGTIPAETRDQIQKYLLELNNSAEGKQILKQAKLTGLKKVVDKDYDVHREIIKQINTHRRERK